VLSTLGPHGWSSRDIATPHDEATRIHVNAGSEYRFFSTSLSAGLVQPWGETALSANATERTLYIRDNATGEYLPLVTSSNVPVGTKFGNGLAFVSATPDLSHVVLESEEPLTPSAVGAGRQLYEWAHGELQLVSVLPDGTAAPEGAALGFTAQEPALGRSSAVVAHAISNDGSRVVWTSLEGGKALHLYVRDTTTGKTVQADAPQGGEGLGTGANDRFQTASSDGSKVFFTSQARLASGSSVGDLYRFDVMTGTLTDLTAVSNSAEPQTEVRGRILGASEDDSYVYFVADGVHAPGALPLGTNLYVWHEDPRTHASATTFIATMSGASDGLDWGANETRNQATARVSPNGMYATFMSAASLTGYDNRDARSGVPDQEVYLYSVKTGHVVCASCNPSGERPTGVFNQGQSELLIDRSNLFNNYWLAATLPAWTPVSETYAIYQSRYLSDRGRLFFNSVDPLVPQDTNGFADVYEYEPEGVGRCEHLTAGFSEQTKGCVGLISSGTSAEESAFLDASEGGGDVFFLTTSQLVAQDQDTSFDIYDAHECTTVSPCLLPAGAPPPACDTTDSCQPPPSPEPGIFGSPPSATLSGAGNLAPLASGPPTRPRLTRAQELAKALRACRHKPKRKRSICQARARRRYASAGRATRAKARKSSSVPTAAQRGATR
jgi:hypothetical protein